MPLRVARLEVHDAPIWAVETCEGLLPLGRDYPTTRRFFEDGGADAAAALAATPVGTVLDPQAVKWLSPVTSDAQFVCQATNYANHVREVGRDPADVIHNVIFRKASSCIVAADAPIVKPRHVQLLDYEIELGLVLRRGWTGPNQIDADTIADWVGGLVIVNDVSARDVQISHEQFHKAKSYRSFGPVGPWLVLIDAADARRIAELELCLAVDGDVRQRDFAGDMIFGPAATLSELSAIMDLNAGDLIATGTPGGVALHPPSARVQRWANFLLSPKQRFKLFLKSQLKSRRYLRPGQIVRSQIATRDGALDLGEQVNIICTAP